jgi:pentatricopeptide repeat protein
MYAEQAVERGMDVLEMMRKDGVEPDGDTYTHLMDMCAKACEAGYIEGASVAMSLLEEARRAEGVVGAATFNGMINTLAKGGRYKEALQVANEMREMGVERGIITWNTVMDAVANEAASGRLSGAQTGMEVIEMMAKDGIPPDVTTWNTLLR